MFHPQHKKVSTLRFFKCCGFHTEYFDNVEVDDVIREMKNGIGFSLESFSPYHIKYLIPKLHDSIDDSRRVGNSINVFFNDEKLGELTV